MTADFHPTARQRTLLSRIRVNAPFGLIRPEHLDALFRWKIRPEVGLDAKTLDLADDTEIQKLGALLREAGVTPSIHGPFVDLAPGALDSRILKVTRDRFRQAIETASLLSPSHAVFHPCFVDNQHRVFWDQWFENSRQTWLQAGKMALDHGFRLVLENTYEAGPSVLRPLFEELSEAQVGFCLDTGHAYAFGQADILEWAEELAPWLAALHLHDNHGVRDEHLAMGAGTIDFPGLFKWLFDRDIVPEMTLEPHRQEDFAPSLAYLAEIWPWPLEDTPT